MLPGRRQRHIARRQERVDHVAVLSLDIDHLPAVARLSQPFEIDAPRLLTEFEKDELLRLILAFDLLAAAKPGHVGIDRGETQGCLVIQFPELDGRIRNCRVRSKPLSFRSYRFWESAFAFS